MARSSRSTTGARSPGILQGSPGRRLLWMGPCALLLLALTWIGPSLLDRGAPAPREKEPERAGRDAAPSGRHILDDAPLEAQAAAKDPPARGRTARPPAPAPEMVSPGELGALLLGIIGLIVACAFGLRRLMRRARLAPGSARILHVVDALPLGPKRHVYAVRMRDRLLIVGAGGEDLTLLAEYEQEDWDASGTTASPRTAKAPEPAPVRAEAPAKAPEPRVQPRARARKAYAASAGKNGLPPGAHRVPPAFRHLLENAVEGEAS